MTLIYQGLIALLLMDVSQSQAASAETTPSGHRIWYVDGTNDGTGDKGTRTAPFDTIGAAIAASAEGDTILIRPGKYKGQVVPKNGQTLIGGGWHNTVISYDGIAVSAAVNLAHKNGVTLKNLRVKHASGIAVMLGNTTNILMERVWADGPFDGTRADSADFTIFRDCKFTSDYDALVLNGRNCLVERCELVTTGKRGDKSAPPGAFRTSCSSPEGTSSVTIRDSTLRVARTAKGAANAYGVEVDAKASVILDNCHIDLQSTAASDSYDLIGIGIEQQGNCLVRAATIRIQHAGSGQSISLQQLGESILQINPASVMYDSSHTVGTITTTRQEQR